MTDTKQAPTLTHHLRFDERLPNAPGWWARRRGGRDVKWFRVVFLSDGPLSVWVRDIEGFVPVERFSSPLTRWAGPVRLGDETDDD
jgi:hypothetical protein